MQIGELCSQRFGLIGISAVECLANRVDPMTGAWCRVTRFAAFNSFFISTADYSHQEWYTFRRSRSPLSRRH